MCTSKSSFSGYSLNDYEKSLENKASLPHQVLIVNYHYGFNIELAKSMLEKGAIVESLLREIRTGS